jgi:hypothetical protein
MGKIQSTLLPLTERLLRLENLFGNLLTKASVVTSAATGDDQQLTASERKKKRKSMQQPAVAAADENSLGRANVAL